MSEETINLQIAIERIYLRDLSFESPRAPGVFREAWRPEVQVDINTRTNQLDENRYEVVLKVTLDAKLEGNSAAIIELEQAGIFRVENDKGEAIEPVLAVACPKMLFPYVRETIDGMMTRGTMPPVMLAPVNFEALFAQALQQQQTTDSEETLN